MLQPGAMRQMLAWRELRCGGWAAPANKQDPGPPAPQAAQQGVHRPGDRQQDAPEPGLHPRQHLQPVAAVKPLPVVAPVLPSSAGPTRRLRSTATTMRSDRRRAAAGHSPGRPVRATAPQRTRCRPASGRRPSQGQPAHRASHLLPPVMRGPHRMRHPAPQGLGFLTPKHQRPGVARGSGAAGAPAIGRQGKLWC